MNFVSIEGRQAEADLERYLTHFVDDRATVTRERLGVLKTQAERILAQQETGAALDTVVGLPVDKVVRLYTARGTFLTPPTIGMLATQIIRAIAGWDGESMTKRLQAAREDIETRAVGADLCGAAEISLAYRSALAAARAYSRPFNTYRPHIDSTQGQDWDSALSVARIPVAGSNPLYQSYRDPFPAIVKLQSFLPERLAFRQGEFNDLRGRKRIEERLMVDLLIELEDNPALAVAACLSFGVQSDQRDPFLFIHELGKGCDSRIPLPLHLL